MSQTTAAEYQLARKTAEEYRRQGYDVSLDTPLEFLPGYRADLIVRKGEQVKVIEVKSRASLAARAQLDVLTREIDARPGWSFELLLVAEPQKIEPPEGAQPFEHARVLERLNEAEALLDAGHAEPAFLLAWSACEAALRLLTAGQDAPPEGIATTAHTLEQAAFLGVISRGEYEKLIALQKHRNASVHGLNDAEFSEELVRGLIEMVRGLEVAST